MLHIASTATGLTSVTFSNLAISNVQSALSGSVVYSASTAVTLTLTTSSYQCLPAPYSPAALDPLISALTPTIGGAFYIVNAVKVISTSNIVKNCYLGDIGGAFYVENTELTDSGSSTFEYNAAVYGGAITCKSCSKLSMTQSTFTNHRGYNGGLIYLDQPGTVTLDSVTVNFAVSLNNGGLLHATGSALSPTATITVLNSFVSPVVWSNLQATVNGGGMYIDHPKLAISMVVPVQVTTSKALSGTGGFINVVNS